MREIAAKHIIYNLEIKNNNQLKKKTKTNVVAPGKEEIDGVGKNYYF